MHVSGATKGEQSVEAQKSDGDCQEGEDTVKQAVGVGDGRGEHPQGLVDVEELGDRLVGGRGKGRGRVGGGSFTV